MIFKGKKFEWLVASVFLLVKKSTSSCDQTCPSGYLHTKCFEKTNPDCQSLKITPTDQLKNDMLVWHNLLRSEFAEGNPNRPYSFSSNMRKMYWDEELADWAKRWVAQCVPSNDRCRTSSRFEVGQNIGLLVGNHAHPDSLQIFTHWATPPGLRFSHFQRTRPSYQRASAATKKVLERFFQLISADTYALGCAEAAYSRRGQQYFQLVCNYGPALNPKIGNILKIGKPCSRCPEGTKCIQTKQDDPFSKLCKIPSEEDSQEENKMIRLAQEFLYQRHRNYNSPYIAGRKGLENRRSKYCNIKCSGEPHVMCNPQFQTIAKSCLIKKLETASVLKKCVVNDFNRLRNDIAGEKVSSVPSASNMRMLVWDQELAELAAKWAEQCPSKPDGCRDVERFSVNQLVFHARGPKVKTCKEIIANFPLLAKEISADSIQAYQKPRNQALAMFSQIIWARSSRIGCAQVTYLTEGGSKTDIHSSLICNFGTGGNVAGKTIYRPGPPCSKCPRETSCSNRKYPFLCAENKLFPPNGKKQAAAKTGSRFLTEKEQNKHDSTLQNAYCKIECNGKQHVMCEKKDAPKSCWDLIPVDAQSTKDCVLDKLNTLRNEVAVGSTRLVSATNMQMLVWDEELEKLAMEHAKQCPKKPDECRDVERFHVNQFVVLSVSSEEKDNTQCDVSIKEVLELVESFPMDNVERYAIPEENPQHYFSQAVWAKSSRIGCAEVSFRRGAQQSPGKDDHLPKYSALVCNFGEGGNVWGQSIFEFGSPCSACPPGTSCKNEALPYLCVE